MSSSSEKSRPNIRIQISNNTPETNAEEKMEVDADENEEGEIIDENSYSIEDIEEIPKAPSATFTTGINIFDKNEQEKLQERAKRFALKPEEIHVITEQDLHNLHDSLGINPVNENEIKFDTVHVHGLQDMSAEDIVNYFACYAPEGIEWIDDKSCNLVWLENIAAARALHFKSRPVKGMPVRETSDLFPQEFLDITEEPLLEEADGQSILVKTQQREVQLQNDIGEIILPRKKLYLENAVDISEITIPIPPGFWRLGELHSKSTCLLVRYGKVSDKLPFKTEKCTKYLKKFPNSKLWTFDATKFSAKNKEVKTLFERNKDLNPWASLARNWDKDSKFREKEPTLANNDEIIEAVEVKNPSLMARLGTKRKVEKGEKIEEEVQEKPTINTTGKKITKMPRMRMYADEEEENQKRRKILKSIKKHAEEIEKRDKPGDLRNMLGPTNKQLRQDIPKIEPEFDLGMKLKNRSQKMIYAVERDPFDEILFGRTLYSDIDSEFAKPAAPPSKHHHSREERRSRSARLHHHHHHHHDDEDVRNRLSEREERFSSSRHSSRRSPIRTLHSDRIYEKNRQRTPRSPEYSSRTGKPRSKVAVVVRPEKKPTVASTIWSKVSKSSSSESESSDDDDSSSSSTSSESGSDSEDSKRERAAAAATNNNNNRPGFDKSRLSQRVQQNNNDNRSPLKITTSNEHFSRSRLRN